MSVPRYESTIMNTIADNLSSKMAEYNVSSFQLADAIGTSRSTVMRIKLGENSTSLFLLIKICDYFDCSLDWLTGVSK